MQTNLCNTCGIYFSRYGTNPPWRKDICDNIPPTAPNVDFVAWSKRFRHRPHPPIEVSWKEKEKMEDEEKVALRSHNDTAILLRCDTQRLQEKKRRFNPEIKKEAETEKAKNTEKEKEKEKNEEEL